LANRRVSTRRATDALKLTCPHCGACDSAVVRSRGGIERDQIRRRRECRDCRRRFSTVERVDRARELLERDRVTSCALLGAAPAPTTWAQVDDLFHRLWTQAVDRQYSNADWLELQRVLELVRRS
jgi:hypothetical protein